MNYKKFYEWYHRDRKLPRRIISNKNFTYRIIISVLDKYCTSKEVFDVGSGVGTLDFYLANQGKQIRGIEISDRAFKIALKYQKKFKLEQRINFIRTDFYRYKSNKTYNFVICSEVLEHLKDDKPALEKISNDVKAHPIRGNAATSHLWIVNPFRGDGLVNLFSTHPPINERIERLKRLSTQIK